MGNEAKIPVEDAITFRPMELADLDSVLVIENSVYSHPWSRQIMAGCIGSNYDSWVLLVEGQIAGYGLISAAVGESHLLNLSVGVQYQRSGLGRKLLQHMLGRARTLGAYIMFLEVRASNKGARRLYYAEGFSEVARRKGYYPAEMQREDALVLSLDL